MLRKRFRIKWSIVCLLVIGLAAAFWLLALTVSRRVQMALRALRDPRIEPVLVSGVWYLPSEFPPENVSMPRILHQTFSSEMVYETYVEPIAACLSANPDWKYVLWRDSDAQALIARHYPHFLAKYRSYKDNLERADSIRYIVLHHFGGIYLDMDVHCRRPFYPALSRLPAFIDQERLEQSNIYWSAAFFAMNSAMGSVPGHPFFRLMIDAMQALAQTGNAFYSTGPSLLTQVYKDYAKREGARPVAILEPRVMSPLMDAAKDWKKLCNNKWNSNIARGCLTLANKSWKMDDSDNHTLAVHRFFHLGYSFASGMRGRSVNLTRIFPDRVTFYNASGDLVNAHSSMPALK